MALKTLGTNATTSLSALQFNHDFAVMSDADLAAFNALVKADKTTSDKQAVQLSRDGHLYIPGRGQIKVSNGDWVAIDTATGWPIILSAAAIASGPYTHS